MSSPSRKEGRAEVEISINRTDPLHVGWWDGGWGGEQAHYQARWLWEISQGIVITFSNDAPTLLHHPLVLHSNNKPSDLLQAVKKLLDSRAMEVMMDTLSLGYYNRLFLVPNQTDLSVQSSTSRTQICFWTYPGPCEHL